jgi:hypothetical protein
MKEKHSQPPHPMGTSGEDIGRPGPWGEGRYQKAGQSVDESVRTPPGAAPKTNTPRSTTVTQRDYDTTAEPERADDK